MQANEKIESIRKHISGYDAEPLFTKDMLVYNGKYYTVGEGHKEFTADRFVCTISKSVEA